ncbi:cytochrome c4 [Guyparkeria hydrothermalis]|uniref:c-type cytochrome n=1 Tax=Guyparkeria hydrothermalis TaxID=923 RepID=UPI0020213521|nr:c-type cytochrome [Guyparkeria hydrothermalis]MCL7745022.1 cytochrome c4 [Guyparkeria hydrothermalis]
MMNAIHPPRRGRFTAGMLLGLTFLAGTAQAKTEEAGSIKAGREATQTCAGCHGAKGNSPTPAFPSLAGQPAKYIAAQLEAYRSGERENAIMNGQASGLTDQQILDIAAYYAAQERKVANPASEGSAMGATLYAHGREGVPACAACHGAEGHGNQPAGFPALRGLPNAYVAQSLKDYRAGKRAHGQGGLMLPVAAELSGEEIDALATHIATLD